MYRFRDPPVKLTVLQPIAATDASTAATEIENFIKVGNLNI
jgi:hypothetical protein